MSEEDRRRFSAIGGWRQFEKNAPSRKEQAESETGYPMDEYGPQGELIAWDREETEACERGTIGCSVHHTRDTECETW